MKFSTKTVLGIILLIFAHTITRTPVYTYLKRVGLEIGIPNYGIFLCVLVLIMSSFLGAFYFFSESEINKN